jgi:uncharacterized protein YndB with AHSA1/START domain
MYRIVESATIERPVTEVFDVAADPHKQLAWDTGMLRSVEKLTPGPLGRGAQYRGDFKGFGVMEYEFVEYEPGRRFAHRARMPMGEMRHVFTFEPVPDGTRMTQEGILTPNLAGRLMWPVMMKRMLRKRFREIAARISQHLATGHRIDTPPLA